MENGILWFNLYSIPADRPHFCKYLQLKKSVILSCYFLHCQPPFFLPHSLALHQHSLIPYFLFDPYCFPQCLVYNMRVGSFGHSTVLSLLPLAAIQLHYRVIICEGNGKEEDWSQHQLPFNASLILLSDWKFTWNCNWWIHLAYSPGLTLTSWELWTMSLHEFVIMVAAVKLHS